MQDIPRLASWAPSAPPGISRLRWRVFARFLVAVAAVATTTVLATLLAQRTTDSANIAAAVGLMTGLGGGAVAALLWSRALEQRVQDLIRTIDSGSPSHGAGVAGDPSNDLFAEVFPAWQAALTTLQEKCQDKHEEARRNYDTMAALMRMIAKAVDERASYLRGHSERVSGYAAAIAWRMGLEEPQIERIRLSSLLHDIGSICVEDYLMLKETPLTPEEFEIVKAHTVKGAAILRPITMLQDLIPGIELHHEALDGTGYPYGLRGSEIPLMARIIAVADAFDAMTTARPYRAPMSSDYVVEVLRRLSGTRYDPAVVDALAELVRSGALEVKDIRVPVSFRMRRPMAEVV